ncbi:MAG TPA: methyl-accepting chemotaxis protein [Hypericibacter adhaerens]|uniref:Methyl-accepting chemotaxis protein n=1 Tax=Hypericibacter adhaerens TaxID=2602016 RepID=A0A5J6N6K8_9PROT|nr:methyl-accepting chemotaxis protein [Hypericibacter adhaerens]QEX24595.1 methyl-accepting chemotaxis protein [Hypericibacter adhaerens]HWA45806.1 methyl-accepting chemotaxis protein [Hypericibacter adhaerens]
MNTSKGGLLATFANMKVKTKVLSGFGLVLLLLATVSGISFMGFSSIGTQFGEYIGAVNIVDDASNIERDVVKLRRNIDVYVGTRDTNAAKDAGDVEKKLQAEIETGQQHSSDDTQKKAFGDVSSKLSEIIASFGKVEELEAERVKIASDVLDVAGPKVSDGLEALMQKATQSGNSNAAILAGTALYEVMKARLYSNLMLERRESSSAEQAEEAFASAEKAIEQIEKVVSDPALNAQVEEIKTLIAGYDEAFKKSEAVDADMEKLVNETIAEQTEAVTSDAEAIASDASDDENKVEDETHGVIDSSEMLSIILSLGGIALGLVIAWLIGSGIAKPVVAMTAAMGKLAGGDKTIIVPALGRKDEIGSMADAVEVFKQNAIEMDRLAEEQRKEQARKEERQKAIEGYIKSFDESVSGLLGILASAATEMRSTAESMSATAEETSRQSTAVAAASEQASTNVQTVASAAEELASSVAEISRRVSESTDIAGRAVGEAAKTNAEVKGLAEAAQKIGNIVQLINDIASQTNLLALNATIEAARAGEAGKGFAVVASEVKSLANQTAKATEEIAGQIQAMQNATAGSVNAIEGIGGTISKISEIATVIASAVEEQGAATQEIARNVQQAAAGTSEVSSNIGGVTQAASQTGAASAQVLSTAGELAKQAEVLRGEVDGFLNKIRAA